MAAVIRLIPWDRDAERGLARAAGDALADIRDQVERGIAQLWECENELHHAYCVTRLERYSAGTEWCIVLFEGRGVREFLPFFVRAAAERGITVRIHVQGLARVRIARSLGFTLREYVLEVTHGRRQQQSIDQHDQQEHHHQQC